MYKRVILVCCLAVAIGGVFALDIVVPDAAGTPAGKMALTELEAFLTRATGVKPGVLSESAAGEGAGRIYLGDTEFARKHGVLSGKLTDEAWVLESAGGSLIIAGAWPRGLGYGVYEFLERYCGVRFLAADTVVAAKVEGWKLPENVKLSGRPAIRRRHVYNGEEFTDMYYFLTRNRNNTAYVMNGLGGPDKYGSPGLCHTYYEYSKDWSKDEYFSLDKHGRRLRAVNSGGPGQICLTHPEVRSEVHKKLLRYIKRDREKLSADEALPPTVYVLAANDNNDYCICEKCLEYTRKGGNYTDTLLNFTNDVANRIKQDYPEVMVLTMAYTFTIKPPKFEKPAENVIIQIANLGREFSYGTSETLMPVNSPVNKEFLDIFKAWAAISHHLAIWDYYILYTNSVNYPYFNLDRIFDDMKFLCANKIMTAFIESENPKASFFALRSYLALRLMNNPDEGREKLIRDFMAGYYGAAAGVMTDYANLLTKCVNGEPDMIGLKIPRKVTYLTPEFYRQVDRMLDEAEKLCAGDAAALEHVRLERIPVDSARLHTAAAGDGYDAILERYKNNLKLLVAKYPGADRQKDIEKELIKLSLKLPPPPQFADKNIVDFIWADFNPIAAFGLSLAEDAEAAGGKAIVLEKSSTFPEVHTLPFVAGAYNALTKEFGPTLNLKEVPADGKYHLYKIGRFNLMPGTLLHYPVAWAFQQKIDKAYPGTPDNYCDIHISLKFTGPAYVAGSREPDRVYFDRLIVERLPREVKTEVRLDPKNNRLSNPEFKNRKDDGGIADWRLVLGTPVNDTETYALKSQTIAEGANTFHKTSIFQNIERLNPGSYLLRGKLRGGVKSLWVLIPYTGEPRPEPVQTGIWLDKHQLNGPDANGWYSFAREVKVPANTVAGRIHVETFADAGTVVEFNSVELIEY